MPSRFPPPSFPFPPGLISALGSLYSIDSQVCPGEWEVITGPMLPSRAFCSKEREVQARGGCWVGCSYRDQLFFIGCILIRCLFSSSLTLVNTQIRGS